MTSSHDANDSFGMELPIRAYTNIYPKTQVRSAFVFQILAFFSKRSPKNTKIPIFISVMLKITIWRQYIHLKRQETKQNTYKKGTHDIFSLTGPTMA